MKGISSLPEGAWCGYPDGMKSLPRLSERARERIAERFRALSEPMRLRILERLFRSPASVGEILESTGGTQANVSKHLAVLHAGGLLQRRREGLKTVYSIADPTLEKICAIVCDAVTREARDEAREIGSAAEAPPHRARRS